MTLTSDYLNRLLIEVSHGIRAEQGSVDAVRLEHGSEGLLVVIEAAGRRLSQEVDELVYHYEPDGLDVSRHATWLVQLFDEDAGNGT